VSEEGVFSGCGVCFEGFIHHLGNVAKRLQCISLTGEKKVKKVERGSKNSWGKKENSICGLHNQELPVGGLFETKKGNE